mmetsp:Transcript_116647/g.371073  ORF Transcript_116647/g.371073 Transcript_116647/m.371073 type:complete len:243 (-) Transcript_116647:2329-3057(-)
MKRGKALVLLNFATNSTNLTPINSRIKYTSRNFNFKISSTRRFLAKFLRRVYASSSRSTSCAEESRYMLTKCPKSTPNPSSKRKTSSSVALPSSTGAATPAACQPSRRKWLKSSSARSSSSSAGATNRKAARKSALLKPRCCKSSNISGKSMVSWTSMLRTAKLNKILLVCAITSVSALLPWKLATNCSNSTPRASSKSAKPRKDIESVAPNSLSMTKWLKMPFATALLAHLSKTLCGTSCS